uniref:Scavenger receptor class F member 1 n=1 Tax=Fundulus heteroclitus TaxID=8078 RepID=A0A3Q2QZY7_FUNHE
KMRFLRALSALLCCSLSSAHTLDPGGKNVCKDSRDSSTLVCCAGWRQQGEGCTIPVCEGERACLENEICVYPGVCRCPPGYFGAQCKTRCPPEFWAPDCRQVCPCFPHGLCNPVTGECTCKPTRWGPLCQNTCRCIPNGRCHPVSGNCICDEGWWSPLCSKACQCSGVGSVNSSCDPLTGRCRCRRGYWGMKCHARCNCNQSPCNERNGVCECEAGSWGSSCGRKCNCDLSRGSCDPASGECLCQPGYMGVSCSDPCKAGDYGSAPVSRCGHCKDSRPCSSTDGACAACEPGWNGTGCDRPCASGFYGDGCEGLCPRCKNDEPCDPKTGKCSRCDAGWSGPRGAVLAGLLVPLFLLFFAVLVCCLCCGGGPADGKNRSVPISNHEYYVHDALPLHAVSHHDPELTFNHSFIEPPSSGWVTEGSSFDSDEEEGEALYCVPPREGRSAHAAGEQEAYSNCNMFLDPSGFSSEDITSPFNIPRTSSIAKSKRPSVSFAEGTRFSPKERRGSGQEPGAPPRTKAKSPWGDQESGCEAVDQEVDRTPSYANVQVPGTSGRRRTMSNTAAGRPVTKTEPSSEGPVQAMLRRLGSLQRQREQDGPKPKSKASEAIAKPPRRKLGARAAVWEQGGPPGGEAKPIRRKNAASEAPASEENTPKRPLSTILKSVPEAAGADCGSGAAQGVDAAAGQTEGGYLTVGPVGEAAQIINDEPCYENVSITQP